MKYEVGQKVYYAPYDTRWSGGRYVTIETIGRRWVRCDEGRVVFDAATGVEDGRGYSPGGRVYASEEVYKDKQIASRLLVELRQRLPWRDDGLTSDDVRAAAVALKIELKEEV